MEKSKKPKTKVYAACEHEYVSYKDLHRLCSKQHTYIKRQDKVLNVLKIDFVITMRSTRLLEKNQELLQSHHEITRAYNGLHEMGKFAEELGIDIKQHQDRFQKIIKTTNLNKNINCWKVDSTAHL